MVIGAARSRQQRRWGVQVALLCIVVGLAAYAGVLAESSTQPAPPHHTHCAVLVRSRSGCGPPSSKRRWFSPSGLTITTNGAETADLAPPSWMQDATTAASESSSTSGLQYSTPPASIPPSSQSVPSR